jgi:hypothetical protein
MLVAYDTQLVAMTGDVVLGGKRWEASETTEHDGSDPDQSADLVCEERRLPRRQDERADGHRNWTRSAGFMRLLSWCANRAPRRLRP